MYVGHLLFVEKLTTFLVAQDIKRPVFQFQNGGIVCLDEYGDAGNWVIKWTLMPKVG